MKKLFPKINKELGPQFPLFTSFDASQPNTPFHNHEYEELIIVYSGSATHCINNTQYKVEKGDVFLIPRSSSHGYKQCSLDFRIFNILFIPELLSLPQLDEVQLPGFWELYQNLEQSKGTTPFFHLKEREFELICALASELFYETTTRQVGFQFNMHGLFTTLLGKLARYYSLQKRTKHQISKEISDVIAFLNTNYKHDISIARLCALSHKSKASLMRNFAKQTGGTPLQYQIHLRISEAALLLRISEKTTAEIAFEVGFNDCNYFARQFKKLTGKTPTAYRKENS